MYPLTKEDLEEVLAWVEFGMNNHPDEASRSSAHYLAEKLRKRIDEC